MTAAARLSGSGKSRLETVEARWKRVYVAGQCRMGLALPTHAVFFVRALSLCLRFVPPVTRVGAKGNFVYRNGSLSIAGAR